MNPLDEVFKKHDVELGRFYPVEKLYKIMYEVGLIRMNRSSFTRNWVNRKIISGQLVLPKKIPHQRWQLTGEQIKDIVYAFAPGGEQRYDYKDHEQPSAEL